MRSLAVLALVVWATPSYAQVYIGAAAGVDTSLMTTFEAGGQHQPDTGGTAPAVAVRAGIGLGQRWGAEVEYARAFTIENSDSRALGGGPGLIAPILGQGIFSPAFRIDSEQQVTSVNALAWLSYGVGARMDLVFLAGASFNRAEIEEQFRLEIDLPPGFPQGVLIDFEPASTRVISYDVGPIVGIEGRITFGDHLRAVPGFRMSAAAGGWSLRPSIGVAWAF